MNDDAQTVMAEMRSTIHHQISGHLHPETAKLIADRLVNEFHASLTSSHIAALTRIGELEKALRPFTKIDVGIYGVPDDKTPDEAEWFRHDGDVLLVGDFRKARAALSQTEEKSK